MCGHVRLLRTPYVSTVRVQYRPTHGGFMVLLPSGAGRSIEFTGIETETGITSLGLANKLHQSMGQVLAMLTDTRSRCTGARSILDPVQAWSRPSECQ